MTHFLKIYDENGDTLEISARWEICPVCDGEGKHSLALGCITGSEWEEWSPEEREYYGAGKYDQRCSDCDGSGKVLGPDFENMTEEEKESWESYQNELANERAECNAERRMGC
jgi:hypothetical protein